MASEATARYQTEAPTPALIDGTIADLKQSVKQLEETVRRIREFADGVLGSRKASVNVTSSFSIGNASSSSLYITGNAPIALSRADTLRDALKQLAAVGTDLDSEVARLGAI